VKKGNSGFLFCFKKSKLRLSVESELLNLTWAWCLIKNNGNRITKALQILITGMFLSSSKEYVLCNTIICFRELTETPYLFIFFSELFNFVVKV